LKPRTATLLVLSIASALSVTGCGDDQNQDNRTSQPSVGGQWSSSTVCLFVNLGEPSLTPGTPCDGAEDGVGASFIAVNLPSDLEGQTGGCEINLRYTDDAPISNTGSFAVSDWTPVPDEGTFSFTGQWNEEGTEVSGTVVRTGTSSSETCTGTYRATPGAN